MHFNLAAKYTCLCLILISNIFFALASTTIAKAEMLPPFYPTLLNTRTGHSVALDEFTPSLKCRECHPTQYSGWSQSMHSFAFEDPLYQAVFIEASRETNGKIDRLCVGCHTPIGTVAEFVWVKDDGEIAIDKLATEGVSCDLCHSIEEVFMLERHGVLGNAGMVLDPLGPKRGPHEGAESEFHETKVSPLHRRSELCGACHNVFHPVGNTKIARTYDEWTNSVYAENDIQCQDCHMIPPILIAEIARTLKKPLLPGSTSIFNTFREPFYPHTFSGANVPIPNIMGAAEHGEQATQLLQLAASTKIDQVHLKNGDGNAIIDVIIRNERAGHNLPTSLSELRQMWVRISVFDLSDGGSLIWQRGGIDREGNIDKEVAFFGAKAVDKEGKTTWKPWRIEKIISDTSIPAKRSVRVSYDIPLGKDGGPYKIQAELLYRSFPQSVANQYLKEENYEVPVITMASDSLVVITEN